MDTILIALAFVGGLTVFIIVGMMVTLYFYTHDALGQDRSRVVHLKRNFTARSVPVQVISGDGQSEINLGLSADPGTRYVRSGMMIMAGCLALIVIAIFSILNAIMH